MMHNPHELTRFITDGLECVKFKLVRKREDFEDDSIAFKPSFCHQIFGDEEKIFGYENLKINMYYTAGPLHVYFDYKFDKKVSDVFKNEKLDEDPVEQPIADILPDGCYYTNLDEYSKCLEKNNLFTPSGEKIDAFDCVRDGVTRHFEIYKCDFNTPNFKSFFLRLETFVLWFVDAASYIDTDDPCWTILIAYEKYKNDLNQWSYATAGYSTVYEFYAYPEHVRPRISQVLILPPFQRHGIATKFVENVYTLYRANDKAIDITFEDPSEDLIRIRNYVDAKLCQSLPCFSPEKLRSKFTKEMANDAKLKFKINKRQCRIIYELLRFKNTNTNNGKEYKAYRLDVKQRLRSQLFKASNDMKRLKAKGFDVSQLDIPMPPESEILEQLQVEYKKVEERYEKIIKRLERD